MNCRHEWTARTFSSEPAPTCIKCGVIHGAEHLPLEPPRECSCMQVCEACEREIVAARMSAVILYCQGRILKCDEDAKHAVGMAVTAGMIQQERRSIESVLALILSEGPRPDSPELHGKHGAPHDHRQRRRR